MVNSFLYEGSVSLDKDLAKATKVFQNYMKPKVVKMDSAIPWVIQDAAGIVFLFSWKMGYVGNIFFFFFSYIYRT